MPVVVEVVHVRTRDYDLDSVLLADLSGEAVFRGLTDLKFSAWELSEAGKLFAPAPAAQSEQNHHVGQRRR
jgi:hypothetical protein